MILQEFSYPLDDDTDIYRNGEVVIGKINLTVESATVAGSKDGVNRKQNEDSFSVLGNQNLVTFAVFDGSSSQKPILALKESGARFASHFLKQEFEQHQEGKKVNGIIRDINKSLLKRNLEFEGASLNDINSMPASTATLVNIGQEEGCLFISHVGDTFCMILYTDGHTELLTVDKNKKYDDEILAKMQKIAQEQSITPREARKNPLISKQVAEMFQLTHNNPDGSGQGVMNGDPNVEKYIQDISVPLDNVKAVILGSDGLVPPGWDETKQEVQKKLFEVVKNEGVKGLIELKQSIENSDPDWNLLRYKHSDDATAIYIKFSKS